MLNLPDPNYDLPYDGSPGMGAFVEFDHAGQHLSGLVIDIIAGCAGPLFAVRVSPGRTVDIHWQRVRVCDMPEDWPGKLAPAYEDTKGFIDRQQEVCHDMLDDRR